MKRIWYILTVPLIIMWGLLGNVCAHSHQIPFDSQHFFYYDEKNVMQRMRLAPKIGIRFIQEMPEDDVKEFLGKFPFISQDKDLKDANRLFMSFSHSTKPQDILTMLSEITVSDIAEATPVFLIDNIEAIVDGIVIQPKIMLSPNDIERRIKRFGAFTLGTASARQDVWVFPISGVKPPLNLFLLINLVHQDEWVLRAYPSLRYLHDPMVSTLIVAPPSGTVDEQRTLSFSVRIYDPRISVDERLLPQFHEGTFMPMNSGKGPPSYLFKMVKKHQSRVVEDNRGKEFIYMWSFMHYGIGEWTIPPQPISYTADGKPGKIHTSSATFVVTSLIGSLAINDMPLPRVLPVPRLNLPAGVGNASLPPLPMYWFDRWIAYVPLVTLYSRYLVSICLVGALFFLVSLVGTQMKRMNMRAIRKEEFRAYLHALHTEALARCSYEPLYQAVSAIMKKAFPHLPVHQEYRFLEEDDTVRRALGVSMSSLVQPIFEELNRAYARDFIISRSGIEALSMHIQSLHDLLASMMRFGEED